MLLQLIVPLHRQKDKVTEIVTIKIQEIWNQSSQQQQY